MSELDIALIIALIISVVIHEMAHGYAANWLGDPTARLAGRLSPNPIVHLDPLMSVILPAFLVLSGSGFIFGAAKPVPYNPYNLTNQKWGEAIVAVAGPASNIVLAIIFAVLVQLSGVLGLSDTFVQLSIQIILLNIFLALFNLLPIPPLDGSKILPALLPFSLQLRYNALRNQMERNILFSFGVVFFLVFFVLGAPLFYLAHALTFLLIGA